MDQLIAQCYKLENEKDATPIVLLQEQIRAHKISKYSQIKDQLSGMSKINDIYSSALPIEQ